MSESGRIVIERVHALEYKMPLKRPYGTARGVTKASTSFLVRLHGHDDGTSITGVGEGQPRRQLTGDLTLDHAWSFLHAACASLRGRSLPTGDVESATAGVREVMSDLASLAARHATDDNRAKPFRGTLLGLEVALLDLVSRSLKMPLSQLLGERRDKVEVTVRTLSTANSMEQFERKVAGQAHVYPKVRVKGAGDAQKNLELLRLVHKVNAEQGIDKPVWIDLNEGMKPREAARFVRNLVAEMANGLLPAELTLEQPIPRSDGSYLPKLQRIADKAGANAERNVSLHIMPDESLWDIDDLYDLLYKGGCGAINIKTAKAGGLLPALRLAEAAVAANPDIRVGIGGMVGTSDITTWSLLNLAKAMPRLDYLTAVPPSNVEERLTEPLTMLVDDSNVHVSQAEPGIGGCLAYDKVFPYITRHAWFPDPPAVTREGKAPNRYNVEPLRAFRKTELDNHLIEREALAFGLATVRLSPLAFLAGDGAGQSMAFSWTRSTASPQTASGVTSDKQSTRILLQRASVPVPRGRRFRAGDVERATAFAEEAGFPVVLKPLRGTGGRDVYTGLESVDELKWAFNSIAKGRYANKDVLVEEHIDGHAHRVFVLGDDVLSVRRSEFGAVVGDGRLTVAELMLVRRAVRLMNPHLMNRPLRMDETNKFQLSKQGMTFDSVPDPGQRVVFTANPNPQQGGETVELLDETDPSVLDAAVRAVRAIPGLRFAGVDFLIPDHRRPLTEQRAGICEINAHPSQASHEFPLFGDAQQVSRGIVRLVAADRGIAVRNEPAERLALRLKISGRVRGVGYRNWFARRAQELGLGGWVRNSAPRTVEALVGGPTEPVAALVSRAVSGPEKAHPEWVESTPTIEDVPDEFELVR